MKLISSRGWRMAQALCREETLVGCSAQDSLAYYDGMKPYADWARWLQILVVTPNALLAAYALAWWWPESEEGRRTQGWAVIYLLAFYLVMHFVFHF